MLPQQEIQKYGGKAAILNHIRDNTNLPIPNYVVKEAGQSLDSILPTVTQMRKPLIVRSSSPYEYDNFEGIFESVRDVNSTQELERAIKKVEESATSEKALEYAKQNGFTIDKRISIMIQEQSPSLYSGAMMRHPNNPDLIFINCFERAERFMQDYASFVVNEKEHEIKTWLNQLEINKRNVKSLVNQYRKIENLTDIMDRYSLFVEFGLEPFSVYQARPFKKIETVDFELLKYDFNEVIPASLAFGITPQEGIVLPVIRTLGVRDALFDFEIPSTGYDWELGFRLSNISLATKFGGILNLEHKRKLVEKTIEGWHMEMEEIINEPYCLMLSSMDEMGDMDLTVTNINTLVTGHHPVFLLHEPLRLFKKANIALGIDYYGLTENELFKNIRSAQDRVRIISNGKEAIVQKE